MDLERINWGNYELLVIDESHNFRNREATKDRKTRYDKLMEEIVLRGVKTKVLLLTATSVNNSLKDLKNQISIITLDNDNAFCNEGIDSISQVLSKSQRILNEWLKSVYKDKEELLGNLPKDFFELLEMITISRSRKHITSYYGDNEVGRFPNKLKPQNIYSKIDINDKLLEFNELNEIVEELNLSVYSPMSYIKSKYKQYYRDLYKQSVRNSFSETLKRMLNKVNSFINKLENFSENTQLDNYELNEEFEDDVLDYKYTIKVDHIDKKLYLLDLYDDKVNLEKILRQTEKILSEKRDLKLHKLKSLLQHKVLNTPYNSGNKKIVNWNERMEILKFNIIGEISREKKSVYADLECMKCHNVTKHANLVNYYHQNSKCIHCSVKDKRIVRVGSWKNKDLEFCNKFLEQIESN